jgi:hypothetical protein
MRALGRYSWIVFILFAVLTTLFGVVGVWTDQANDTDMQLLVSTYAAVAVVLTVGIATTAFRRGERWAWAVMWIWPVFFAVHGAAFFVVDYAFSALGVMALLAAAPPRTSAVVGDPELLARGQ